MRTFLVLFLSMFAAYSVQATPINVPLKDGYGLAGDIFQQQSTKGAVLLFHQCNRDRKMWEPVVQLLNDRGFSTMTVDARGFGESKSEKFDISVSDEVYDAATAHFPTDAQDVYATWVAETRSARTRAVIGASCGGAMASRLAGMHTEINALILFSPALRPYWFAEELWAPLHAREMMPILGIVSIGDTIALTGVERAVNASEAEQTEFIRYNGRRHGEPLFEFDPALPNKMAVWIDKALQ